MNSQQWQKDQVLGDRISRNLKDKEKNEKTFSNKCARLATKFLKQYPTLDIDNREQCLDAMTTLQEVRRLYKKHIKSFK